MAARSTRTPFVTTFHGAHEAKSPLKRWYNSSLVKGDRVIANSRFTGDRILADYALDPGRMRVIPRGADLKRFNPAHVTEKEVDAVQAQLWPEQALGEGPLILFPARLTAWKGQILALDALTIIKAQVRAGKAPAFRLSLCGGAEGDTGFAAVLRAEIEKRGVRDMVHLAGDIADMPAAYKACDAVVAASLRPEPFGRTAVEAGASGLAVVAPNHGGFSETIVNNETGLLFAPSDADGLAHALMRLAGDDGLRRRLGDNARARVTALFSAQAMCDATLDVYRDVLGNGA